MSAILPHGPCRRDDNDEVAMSEKQERRVLAQILVEAAGCCGRNIGL
jgi:hypothetical protein